MPRAWGYQVGIQQELLGLGPAQGAALLQCLAGNKCPRQHVWKAVGSRQVAALNVCVRATLRMLSTLPT